MSKPVVPVALASLATVLAATLVSVTLGTGGVARAQDPGGRPPWVAACEADMAKLCDAEMKNNADVRPCLSKHEAELSQTCKDVFLRKYRILEMCKDDIDKICGGASDGKTLSKCFNEKQAELSDKCKTALRAGTKEKKAEDAAKAAASGEKPATTAEAKPAAKGKGKSKAKAKKPAAAN